MPPHTTNPPSTDPPPSYESQNPPATAHPQLSPPPSNPIPTTRTHEPLPRYTPHRWAPYATEAEYLTALRAWAEEKTFVRLDENTGLEGFYGKMTMRDYAEREGGWRADGGKGRRKKMGEEGKEGEEDKEKGRGKRGVGRWFRRRESKGGEAGV
ncbi:MAG: hypothetical protein Q9202_006983 [Teloschistes flavicans]